MKPFNPGVAWLGAALCTATYGHEASAADPDADRIGGILLAGAGYGTQDDSDAGSYGPAFGLKVGYVPVWLLHVGAQGTFHWGSRFGDEQNRVQLYGAEVGLRLGPEPIRFVPYLAGGIAIVESQRNVDPRIFRGYFALGGHAELVALEPLAFGLDVRYSVVPTGSDQADNVGPTGTLDVLGLVGVVF